jgi:hypothetical protein
VSKCGSWVSESSCLSCRVNEQNLSFDLLALKLQLVSLILMLQNPFYDLEGEVQTYYIGNIKLSEVHNRSDLCKYGLVVQGYFSPMGS